MAKENIAVLMGAHGYPNAGRIPYHGGLDDVVEGISSYLPEKYRVHVLAQSGDKEEIIYRPRENVAVYASPAIPFEAGENYAYQYTPLDRHCDDFMAHALDSKIHALKNLVPEIIKNSDGVPIAHMHDYFSGPLGIELKKQRLPFIFHCHLSADRKRLGPYFGNCADLRQVYEKASCDKADIIIAVSKDTKDSLVNAYDLPLEKVRVIENAIDTEKFRPATEEEKQRNGEYLAVKGIPQTGEPIIYWNGRYVREKGPKNLLKVFEVFSPEHEEHRLVLTGFNGNLYSELASIRSSMTESIRGRVYLLNEQLDVIPFYQECQFAVYPSEYEAFGLVAVQAQACAKPVVAGNVGGFKCNVKGEFTGIHVDPLSPQSIAEGMALADQNSEKWGKNARQFVLENYSLEKRIPDYMEVYKAALEAA